MVPPATDAATVSPADFHAELAALNRERFAPSHVTGAWAQTLERHHAMALRECAWLEREQRAVAPMVRDVPSDAGEFGAWFSSLREWGPGQGDPLFGWLETTASPDEMRWFLRQELAGEAGFDDLVAMSQVDLPARPKLEMARNYWDEMGRGTQTAMHGPMLARLGEELALGELGVEPVWESRALANLMVGLASHRHLAYHAIGALGVIELTAPDRAESVNAGLVRLGVGGHARKYYAMHATMDIKHFAAWNREVLQPLVDADPALAIPLAEGALMRLRAGERCFVRYRREFGIGDDGRVGLAVSA